MPTIDTESRKRHLPLALGEEMVLSLADIDPPAAAADDDARARLADAQAGVAPGFARGDDADERRP